MEENPYITPTTPSDKILNQIELSEIDDAIAYREGSTFFCKPGFLSPPICFQTGNTITSSLEKTTLLTGTTSIALYLTRGEKIDWVKIISSIAIITFFLAIIAVTFLLNKAILITAILVLIPLFFKNSKNYGIKLKYLQTGYIQIKDAHEDFLKHFQEKGRQTLNNYPKNHLERSP